MPRASRRTVVQPSARARLELHAGARTLANLYEASGDTAKLRRAIGLLAATDSGNVLAGERMLAAATLGDSGDVRSLRAQIPRLPTPALNGILYGALADHIGLDDAARAVAALKASAATPSIASRPS